MKLSGTAILFLLFAAQLNAAEVLPRKSAVLLLSGETQTAEGRAAVEKLKAGMAAQGVSVTELPADEVQDIGQAALIAGGGPVVLMESQAGKIGFKVYDGVSGADITKTFHTTLLGVKSEINEGPPEPVKKIALPSAPQKSSSLARNHIGVSIGPSYFVKNKDSLEVLQQFNTGARIKHTKTTGRFQLFYERNLPGKFTLGLSAEFEKGGGVIYNDSGRTLAIDPKHKVGNVYVMRNFGKYLGIYLGGGADIMSLRVEDPSDMAGVGPGHEQFKSALTAPHAEAGAAFSAKNFSLRFSLRKILAAKTGEMTTTVNGITHILTVKNGKTLSSEAEGQSLDSNEQLYKADFGGTAAAISLTYSFANW